MTQASPFDRSLLGNWGFALDDDSYVQVVAGMGQAWTSLPSVVRRDQDSLLWTPHNFLLSLKRVAREPGMGGLWEFRDRWLNSMGSSRNRRVLLKAEEFRPGTPDLVAVARILKHPAVGAESVFFDIPVPQADLKWQWPLRISALSNDVDALELSKLTELWPSNALTEFRPLSREHARSEMLVLQGGIRGALGAILTLRHRVRTGHLLLLGPLDARWHDLRGNVEALLAETQAGAFSLVTLAPGASVAEHINTYVRELSHNEPYDFALARAFPGDSSLHFMAPRLFDHAALNTVARHLGQRLRALPPTAALKVAPMTTQRLGLPLDNRPAVLGAALENIALSLPVDHESYSGLGLREIADAERAARDDVAIGEAPRYLQGDLTMYRDGRWLPETRGLVLNERYRLDVIIGLPGEGAIAADLVFPEEEFAWRERDSYTLQVLFADPLQWETPFRGTLELPRQGTSSKSTFVFSPTRTGLLQARVTVYYRGRVLQTALLNAVVVQSEAKLDGTLQAGPLRFQVEVEVRQSLGSLEGRRRFDTCMVLNHAADGTRTMTAAGAEGAYIASLDELDEQLVAINGLLNDVALNTRRYGTGLTSAANANLLGKLALEGNLLYRHLVLDYIDRSSAAQALRDSEYLQIVSAKPDAIVPLEFVYDFPPPKDGAKVCKNALQALQEGRCPADCRPASNPAEHVCPLGFWGLSKVIEREMHDPGLAKAALVKSEPIGGRKVLSLRGACLLATSEQVRRSDGTRLAKYMESAWNGGVAAARKWADWRAEVQARKPVLLVALPHADGAGSGISLEISGDVLRSLFIDRSYVRAGPDSPPPVALLLGCDTTNVAYSDAYARHVAIFRQADAALVLGTVATILGADAAKVAAKLVKQLTGSTQQLSGCFGEVLRQVKREAVAESLMVAMALIAFGDADWYLECP